MDEYVGGKLSLEKILEDFEDLTSTPLSLDRPDGEDWDEEEHEEFEEDLHVRSEVGEIMMELWEPKGEDAVVESLQKMSLLAQERSNNLKIIRTAGAIPLLVDMVKPSPHVSRSHSLAIECFAHLSKNILNRIEIAESGGLTPLLSCLAVVEETDLLHILNCLFECSKSPLKIRAMLRKAGAIETLLPLITVGNEAVQILLLDIIKLYSDEESQQAIQYANGIPSIIQLIGTGTPKIQKRAMRTLASLCGSNVKTQASLHKTEAIDTIVTLLGSKDEGVQKAAAETLTLLTMNDFTNQSAARKAGGIKLVVPLLSSRDNAVKVRACLAIRSLAKGNVKVQCEFREAGALKSLIRLLEESSDGVIFHATSALAELANNSSRNAEEICFEGGATLLVSFLRRDNAALQYQAEGAIWAIARKSAICREEFVRVRALQPLQLLQQSPNEQIRLGANWALDALEKQNSNM